ncbi:MAG: tyrosine-type recombinase/integrase [Propionibacteriaceae bacterium]|nr:tyrosine-type recombinase/integrase [Propionibacteriaceae bacterium]
MAKRSGRRIRGEGSIFQIETGLKKGQWCGQVTTGYKDNKRVRKSVFAPTETACLKKVNDLKQDLARGIMTDNTSLSDWIEYWLSEICPHRLSPKTLYEYRNKMRLYVVPVIGRTSLRRLTPNHIRDVHKEMRNKNLSENTILQTHRILSRCLKVAEREGKMKHNPASLTDAPSRQMNPTPILSVDQARKVLANASDEREFARLTCALVLGIRQGEALALTWDDVDFTNATLRVDESVSRIPGSGLVTKDPKTRSSKRTLPLPGPTLAVFKAWYAKSAGNSPYVFPGQHSGPEGQKRDWKMWRDSLKRAGVPHVPLHGARGTAASTMLAMKIPERVIADILGHARVDITMTHYLHSDDQQRLTALDELDSEFWIAPLAVDRFSEMITVSEPS